MVMARGKNKICNRFQGSSFITRICCHLTVCIILLHYCAIKQTDGQLEAVSAALSVVPVTSILATAGVVGMKLAALSRLLQALGYDRAYLANGGSGTAAEPIGLQHKYAYMFPYVPGLNISVKGEHSTEYQNQAAQQANRESFEHATTRKTFPSMSLPGDYENQNRPFRGVDTLKEIFKNAGITMMVPNNQQQQQKHFPPKGNIKNLIEYNSNAMQQATTPIYNQNNNLNHQQQQQTNAPVVIPPPLKPPQQHEQIMANNNNNDQQQQQQPSFSRFPAPEQSGQQTQQFNQQQQQQQPQIQSPSQVNIAHQQSNNPSVLINPNENENDRTAHSKPPNVVVAPFDPTLRYHVVPTPGFPYHIPSSVTTAPAVAFPNSPIITQQAPIVTPKPTQTPSPSNPTQHQSETPLHNHNQQQQQPKWFPNNQMASDSFHPIPQHEFYSRKILERVQADAEWMKLAKKRPSKQQDRPFYSVPISSLPSPDPLPSGNLIDQPIFEPFDIEQQMMFGQANRSPQQQQQQLKPIQMQQATTTTSANTNSNLLNAGPLSSESFSTNSVPLVSFVTDGPPPFNDEMDHNEFNLVNRRRRRRRRRDLARFQQQQPMSLAGKLATAATGSQREPIRQAGETGATFGMPASNIHPGMKRRRRRRRRRSLAAKILETRIQ